MQNSDLANCGVRRSERSAGRKRDRRPAVLDEDNEKPRAATRSRRSSGQPRETTCKVDGCGVSVVEKSVRLVRVCPEHRRALLSVVNGQDCRFCQQCSRFHELYRFDGNKRGCRKRLSFLTEKHRRLQGLVSDAEDEPQQPASATDKTDLNNGHHQDCKQLRLEDNEINWGEIPDEALEDDPFQLVAGMAPSTTHSKGAGEVRKSLSSNDSMAQIWLAGGSGRPQQTSHVPNQTLNGYGAQQHQTHTMSTSGQEVGSTHQCAGVFCQLCKTDHFVRHCDPPSGAPSQSDLSGLTFNVALKIHQATPLDLPLHLKDDLISLCQILPEDLRGFIRPGCVHLSVDFTFASAQDGRTALRNLRGGLLNRSLWPAGLAKLFSGFDVDISLPFSSLKIQAGDSTEVPPTADGVPRLPQPTPTISQAALESAVSLSLARNSDLVLDALAGRFAQGVGMARTRTLMAEQTCEQRA